MLQLLLGVHRPVGIEQGLAAQRDEVGGAARHQVLCRVRVEDEADRHDRDAGAAADLGRIVDAEIEPARHACAVRGIAGNAGRRRAVEHVDARVAQRADEADHRLHRQRAVVQVGQRDAPGERPLGRPCGTHGTRDLERKALAVGGAAAVAVGAPVGFGREELVDQVAVRAMDLEHLEAGIGGAPRGSGPGRDQRMDLVFAQCGRRGPAHVDRQCARPDHRPRRFAARRIGVVQRTMAMPPGLQRTLAAGVAELDRRHRALAAQQVGHAPQRRHLRVVPQADVAVRVAPARFDRGRLDEHDARAAEREAPEMHQVPVVRQAAFARRVLLHRRDRHAVACRHAAQLHGLEQHAPRRERRVAGSG